MALYLTVSEGPRADRTRPILVVSDERVIATVMREIGNLANPEPHQETPRDFPADPSATRPWLMALPGDER